MDKMLKNKSSIYESSPDYLGLLFSFFIIGSVGVMAIWVFEVSMYMVLTVIVCFMLYLCYKHLYKFTIDTDGIYVYTYMLKRTYFIPQEQVVAFCLYNGGVKRGSFIFLKVRGNAEKYFKLYYNPFIGHVERQEILAFFEDRGIKDMTCLNFSDFKAKAKKKV